MSDTFFHIPKLTDRTIVQGFRNACPDSLNFQGTVNGIIQGSGHSMSWALTEAQPSDTMRALFDAEGMVFREIQCEVQKPFQCMFWMRRKPGEAWEHVGGSWRGGDPSAEFPQMLARLQHELRGFHPVTHIGEVIGKDAQGFFEEREAGYRRLEQLVTRLTEDAAKEYEQNRDKLRQAFERKEQELSAANERRKDELHREHEAKADALKQREAALLARESEIDASDNRSARRSLRADIKNALTKRSTEFSLTEGTRDKRRPVHVLCGTLIAVFAAILLISAFHAPTDSESGPAMWIHLGRQLTAGLGLATTAVFYLRWLNQWFQQHAHEEFKLKRLELDLDRASWVVEMVMEWKDEKGSEIPAALIEKLTQNIFADPDVKTEILHPGEQVANALFGAAAEASVSLPGGTTLKLDRKAIRELEKSRHSD